MRDDKIKINIYFLKLFKKKTTDDTGCHRNIVQNPKKELKLPAFVEYLLF